VVEKSERVEQGSRNGKILTRRKLEVE